MKFPTILGASAALFASAWAQDTAQEEVIDTNIEGEQAITSVDAELTDEQREYIEWANAFEAKLTRQTGEIEIADGAIRLTVPENFYYLSPDDAQAVLVEAWGNPEDATTLGMLFPAGSSPLDAHAWGVDLGYEEMGYVSDSEAEKIDYDELLGEMQQATKDENQWREENGYGTINLVGWAEQPNYDQASHKMVWAKHLKFSSSESETLNYNVRALGRYGVMNANFIATMDQLDNIKMAAPDVSAMISFNDTYRYDDYQQGDKVAAYGLAGLVAGGAIAKKTGLIGLIILAAKKFGVFIIAGLAAGFGILRKAIFGKKSDSQS